MGLGHSGGCCRRGSACKHARYCCTIIGPTVNMWDCKSCPGASNVMCTPLTPSKHVWHRGTLRAQVSTHSTAAAASPTRHSQCSSKCTTVSTDVSQRSVQRRTRR